MATTPVPTRPRDLVPRSVLGEVAAYVGAPAAAAAAGLLAARHDVGSAGQLLVATGAGAVFLIVGALAGDRSRQAARLRSVLWFAAALAWFAVVQILVIEVLELDSRAGAVLDTVVSAVGAGVLWWWCARPLQQLAVFLALLGVIVAVALPTPSIFGFDTTVVGVLVWVFGLGWLAAAATGRIRPVRTGMVLGTLGGVVAPLYLVSRASLAGEILALVTAVGLLLVGARLGERAVEGISIVGIVAASATIVSTQLDDPEAVTVVALVVGLLLLGLAAAWTRRAEARPPSTVPPGAEADGPIPPAPGSEAIPGPPAPPGPSA